MKTRLASTASGSLLLLLAGQACEAQVDAGYQGEPLVTLAGQVDTQQASPAGADVGVLWLASAPEDGCTGPQRTEIGFETGSPATESQRACTDACGSAFDPAGVEAWKSCQRACGVEAQVGTIVNYSLCGSGAIGQTTPVFGDFPAQFSLDVLRPPPERALIRSDTGERLALGYFVALAPRADSLAVSLRDGPPPWLLGGSETHMLLYAAEPIAYDSSWGIHLGGSFEPGYHLMRVSHRTHCADQHYSPYHRGESGPPPMLPQVDPTPAPPTDSDAGAPDSGSQPTDADPVGQGDPGPNPAAVTEVASVPQSSSGVARGCGNGVCEAEESCDSCSDCTDCSLGILPGSSSGITSQMPGYHCRSEPAWLIPAEGDEGDIQLLIARPELIDWPQL